MQRKVVGFRQDERGDWIIVLDCGHVLHARHQPPWQVREWVLSEAGRQERVGMTIACTACDAFASGDVQ
jgi:hypothetical protein